MRFNDFLKTVLVNNFNLINIDKSLLDKYEIKVINNVIVEKQIFELKKIIFVCFKNTDNLQFHLNNFHLLFNPLYAFTFNNNGYIVVNNDWKTFIKYLNENNAKSIIKHLIISVLCGLNQISKTIKDKNFNSYNINDFRININNDSKVQYKLYNTRINKTLIYKPKYNIKYFGNNDKLENNLGYETVAFYNFLFSFYQYFKITKKDKKDNVIFKIFTDYLNILTKEDNFKSLKNNNIQSYITEHKYYETYEELLNLRFVFKTIGYRFIKQLRNIRKKDIMKIKNMKNDSFNYRFNMLGGQITEEIEDLYNDVDNIEQINKLQDYSNQNNNHLFSNINEKDNEILKEYEEDNNVPNSRYHIVKIKKIDNVKDFVKSVNKKDDFLDIEKLKNNDNEILIDFETTEEDKPYVIKVKPLKKIISKDNDIFNNYLSIDPNKLLPNKPIKEIDYSLVNDKIDSILKDFDVDTTTIKKDIKYNNNSDESLFNNINKWIDNELIQFDTIQNKKEKKDDNNLNVRDFLQDKEYNVNVESQDTDAFDIRTDKKKKKNILNDENKIWFGIDDQDDNTKGGNENLLNINNDIKKVVDNMIDSDKIDKIIESSSVKNKRLNKLKSKKQSKKENADNEEDEEKEDDLTILNSIISSRIDNDNDNDNDEDEKLTNAELYKKYWLDNDDKNNENPKGGINGEQRNDRQYDNRQFKKNNENRNNNNNNQNFNKHNNQQFKHNNGQNYNQNFNKQQNYKPQYKKPDNEVITRSYNEPAYKLDFENDLERQKTINIMNDLKKDKEQTFGKLMGKTFITKGKYYGLYQNQYGEIGNEFHPYKERLNTFYIEDLIPPKFNVARFNFGDIGQRIELVNYLNDFILNKTKAKDIDANSISSLFKVMKIINTYPEAYKGNDKLLKYESKLNEVRPDYVSFRSCYPLKIENEEINCAANSTFINVKLYNLTHGEYYLRNKFKLLKHNDTHEDKQDDNDNSIYKDFKTIYERLTEEDINVSATFREAKYYDYITKNIIESYVCPHFPLLIGYKVVKEDTIDTEYIDHKSVPSYVIGLRKKDDKTNIQTYINSGGDQYDYQINYNTPDTNNNTIIIADKDTGEEKEYVVKKSVFDKITTRYGKFDNSFGPNDRMLIYYILKETNEDIFKKNILIKDPNTYTTKTLVLITENPGYSFDSWFKPEYIYENNMRKMVDTGYKSLEEWKTIIFQILYTFQIINDRGISIPNLSIDNLFVQHSNIDLNDNYYYSIYKINNVSYYVPFYGDMIMFDLIHKDVINTDKQLILS